jgi:hypothetical protein
MSAKKVPERPRSCDLFWSIPFRPSLLLSFSSATGPVQLSERRSYRINIQADGLEVVDNISEKIGRRSIA